MLFPQFFPWSFYSRCSELHRLDRYAFIVLPTRIGAKRNQTNSPPVSRPPIAEGAPTLVTWILILYYAICERGEVPTHETAIGHEWRVTCVNTCVCVCVKYTHFSTHTSVPTIVLRFNKPLSAMFQAHFNQNIILNNNDSALCCVLGVSFNSTASATGGTRVEFFGLDFRTDHAPRS